MYTSCSTFLKKEKVKEKQNLLLIKSFHKPLQTEHNITIQTSKNAHGLNANDSLLFNNVYKYDLFWKWPTFYLKICIRADLYISFKNAFTKVHLDKKFWKFSNWIDLMIILQFSSRWHHFFFHLTHFFLHYFWFSLKLRGFGENSTSKISKNTNQIIPNVVV